MLSRGGGREVRGLHGVGGSDTERHSAAVVFMNQKDEWLMILNGCGLHLWLSGWAHEYGGDRNGCHYSAERCFDIELIYPISFGVSPDSGGQNELGRQWTTGPFLLKARQLSRGDRGESSIYLEIDVCLRDGVT